MLQDLLLTLLAFGAVWLLDRQTHRRLQQVFLLLTGRSDSATLLYSLVLLPGVALHELSHAVAALLLRVRVLGFSLRPRRLSSKSLQLGYVETLRTDVLRSSLIGAAPLFAGVGALLLISREVFGVRDLSAAAAALDPHALTMQMRSVFTAEYAPLWIYAMFAVANGMMPSPSDRRAWPPVLAGVVLIGIAAYAAGGAMLLDWVRPGMRTALQWLGGAFTLTAFVNAGVLLVLVVCVKLLERVTGRRFV